MFAAIRFGINQKMKFWKISSVFLGKKFRVFSMDLRQIAQKAYLEIEDKFPHINLKIETLI